MKLVFLLILLFEVILSSLWIFIPSIRPTGMTTDGVYIFNIIVFVSIFIYTKENKK